MNFYNADFLLNSEYAKKLYHDHAKKMPIIDYHCHISAEDIARDRPFNNIAEMWLGGDHYKWRLMREQGIEEKYISGDADDQDKFVKWIETVEVAIGNPVYHWCHMELSTYFGYIDTIRSQDAEKIWRHCNSIIKEKKMSPKQIIKQSNVKLICTTNCPLEDLTWHNEIRNDKTFDTIVLPAFRPDEYINIRNKEFKAYIEKLSDISNKNIESYNDLLTCLKKRVNYFDSFGCRLSDHGIEAIPMKVDSWETIEKIFSKAIRGDAVTEKEAEAYQTDLLKELAYEYKKLGWTMQIHYGVKRNVNSIMFEKHGLDTGFDSISGEVCGEKLPELLDYFSRKDALPKTIIYPINSNDDAYVETVAGCFQRQGFKGYVQHGAAWWYNDHISGMRHQLKERARTGMLPNFVGMITDSRSFLSYTRHDYFRRVLCQLFGEWMDAGLICKDEDLIGQIVENISYYNAAKYFNWEEKNEDDI